MRAALVTEMEVGSLYRYIIPSLGIILSLSIVLTYVVSRIEIRNGAGMVSKISAAAAESREEENENKTGKGKYWLNGILTVLILISLFTEILPTYACFMIGSAIALLINFPNPKDQAQRIKSYAGQAMVMTMTLFRCV